MDRRHPPPVQDSPATVPRDDIAADGLPGDSAAEDPPTGQAKPARAPLFDRRTGRIFGALVALALILMLVVGLLLAERAVDRVLNPPEPTPEPTPDIAPLGPGYVQGAPSVDVALIRRVLLAYNSPAVDEAQAFYDLGVARGIDPAYCLAFFIVESGAGSRGVARTTYSIGNIRALTGHTTVLGTIGEDRAGEDLCEILQQQGVETHGLVVDPDRPTTLKTRIVAHHQQIVRFDRERVEPASPASVQRLLENFSNQLSNVSAVIFEDYGKGVLSQGMLNTMQKRARGKITAADPTARHLLKFTGLTAITPNRSEAFAAAGIANSEPHEDVLRDESLMTVGRKLLAKWKPANLLITLGEHGMCLFRHGKKPHHIPTTAQEVFDVSGAGDTAIAALVLALAAGANPVEAAEISNHAAGIVVGKVGTATCSPDELRASFARNR